MLSKILAICPYSVELLKALVNTIVMKIADVKIIGSKNKIVETSYLHNINYHIMDIIDVKYDLDICFKANDMIKQDNIKGIIFGDFSLAYQKNIVKTDYEINIIDLPKLNHLIFISNNIKNDFIGFEEKKGAIIAAKNLMKKLNIDYFNIGLVSGNPSNTTKIEKNVIKLTSELSEDNIDVINIEQIFANNYNVLVFNDVNSSRIFIDTIMLSEKGKYANIKKASTHYVIDAKDMKLKNIFFSIYLLNKMGFNTEAC